MRSLRGAAWAALACIVTVSCVSTLGLDHFTKSQEEDADIPDVVPDLGPPPDYSFDATNEDTSVPVDVAQEPDVADAGVDADAADAAEADPDACPPADKPNHCGACDNVCDTVNSVGASCDGTKCLYTACAPNHADCNKTAPNLAGCECPTPGCCSGACQTTHSTGTDASYYDCVDAGTITLTQAAAACNAYSDGGTCTSRQCQNTPGTDLMVCTSGLTPCVCWSYSGSTAPGHVASSSAGCPCPLTTDPTWN